ncbi:MAG TPA: hypothetical protein VK658_07405 [Chryseolinea sp.]|nr:hypothetical protein [Chryseolinea sp.]
MYSTLLKQAIRCLPFLMVCAVMWSCDPNPQELEKEELALYNDMVDQLAWQCDDACNRPPGLNAIVWSNQHADSVKNILRAQTDKRVLYYQPKIGTTRKISELTDWLTVELSSWDRFFSTFTGTTAKNVVPNLTISSALKTGELRVDYMEVVQLDTASQGPLDNGIAVVTFSKPHYSKDRNRAVMYFESGCGSKKARGELLMMRLKENRWVIEERRKVWLK